MSELAVLWLKRNRGWPWPDDSWGLSQMYGDDGWCRSCGVPKGPQTGSLVLSSKGFKASAGAWVPNWRFDAVCLGTDLSEEVEERFPAVSLMPIKWRNGQLGRATQIVPEMSDEAWFDPDELRKRVVARHGSAGAECPTCGVWRWYPLAWSMLPPLRAQIADDVEVAASQEWFGDGCRAFRELVFRRPLAETIARASPRDFEVRPLP
jgi:hypothetical protein